MSHDRQLKWIKVDSIVPNTNNPREPQEFKPDALDSLRYSMETHGPLAPIIVAPYRKDEYKLIDGDRRLKTAKLLGMPELPAMIVDKMPERDELVTAFNIHTQFRNWGMPEQLRVIKDIMSRNGHRPEPEIAKELGIELTTFRDRLRVLDMGETVVNDISADKIEYSGALRSDQVADMLARKRPELVDKLGGRAAVRDKLIAKAKTRKRGISQELVQVRRDLADTAAVPDRAVEQYIKVPEAKLQLTGRQRKLGQRPQQAVPATHSDGFVERLQQVQRDANRLDPEGLSVAALGKLRRALAASIDALSSLEARVSEAIAGTHS